MINLNGAPAWYRKGSGCAYVRLPAEMQREILGGCQCAYCVANPDLVPMWDTLAVPTGPRQGGEQTASNTCFTVHMPEMVSK